MRGERIQIARKATADNGSTLNAGLVALCFSRGSGPLFLWNPLAF